MANIYEGPSSANVPSMAGVGTVSEIIVPMNNDRVGLMITNISSQTVYLALGGHPATLRAGIVLTADGGAFSLDSFSYTKDAVSAIAHASTLVVAFQEMVRS